MAKCLTVLTAVFLVSCSPPQRTSAVETELCLSWGESLPTRSRQDTPQTAAEIQTGYADFANACPAFAHLIP